MTTDSATYPATNARHGLRAHLPMSGSIPADYHAERYHSYLPADTRSGGPRGPHPGDIIYWVACLGGACLLLFAATT